MASFIFNVALGRVRTLAEAVGGSTALVVIPIEASGVESDATLRDYDTVAALLAGASNEQSTMGRKTITSASATVNDTDNRLDIDIDDVTWSAATGNAISDLLVAYSGDTGTDDDSDLIPVSWHDFSVTPDGSDIVAAVADLIRAASSA